MYGFGRQLEGIVRMDILQSTCIAKLAFLTLAYATLLSTHWLF